MRNPTSPLVTNADNPDASVPLPYVKEKKARTLSDAAARNARPAAAVYKISERGLQLVVHPDGARRWRFAYRHNGKQKTLSLGTYPETSVAKARELADDARQLVKQGIDPVQARKERQRTAALNAANTFEIIVEEWFDRLEGEGIAAGARSRSPTTIASIRKVMQHATRRLTGRPINEITAPELLQDVLRPLERQGKFETAKRLRARCAQVWNFAIASGRAQHNPAAGLQGVLKAPVSTRRAAITGRQAVGQLLRAIRAYPDAGGNIETSLALELLAYTALRPGEVRLATWDEIDLSPATPSWTTPASRMKSRQKHRVALSPQSVDILRRLHALCCPATTCFHL